LALYLMQYCIASKIVPGAMGLGAAGPHTLAMARKARPRPKQDRRPTQIKAWRRHRGLSLEKLGERLSVEEEFEISEAQLSRIERGAQPYSQDILEAIARVLRCAPEDLLIRDPTAADPIWTVWDTLSPPQKTQAVELLKVLKRTGTEG
jgi:transcriptional regulator with XRE-family HTH domain